jgi:hypothetical protein
MEETGESSSESDDENMDIDAPLHQIPNARRPARGRDRPRVPRGMQRRGRARWSGPGRTLEDISTVSEVAGDDTIQSSSTANPQGILYFQMVLFITSILTVKKDREMIREIRSRLHSTKHERPAEGTQTIAKQAQRKVPSLRDLCTSIVSGQSNFVDTWR